MQARLLCAAACLAILSGCSATAPVITESRTDMVKVRLNLGDMAPGATSFQEDPQGHELYLSVLDEAKKGCALHDRQAVEISWTHAWKSPYDSYEFLFACVERQEEEQE